jgi:pimeloyl-ACP methyl ester carboxylesterase
LNTYENPAQSGNFVSANRLKIRIDHPGDPAMTAKTSIDYDVLDRSEVLTLLFHPRAEPSVPAVPGPGVDVSIPLEDDIFIGARFHMIDKDGANILFFHGNGEIVSDYNDLAPLYNQMGINFLPVDYRGYGRSNGEPTVSSMMQDCHIIFDYAKDWLGHNGYRGPLILMGRSLGSASALELAASYNDTVDALIIESGFALASPLLRLLGIDAEALGFREESGFRNTDKIGQFHNPTLIIHAEYDHIIPFSDGQLLYDSSAARKKRFLKIPGANHNDIFARGLSQYLSAIKELVRDL